APHERIRYAGTDLVFNFFVGKTEVARRVRWDERLRAIDHDDFFLSAYKAGVNVVYCPDSVVIHRKTELPVSQEYMQGRFNNTDGSTLVEKWGQDFLPMSALTCRQAVPAPPAEVFKSDQELIDTFLAAPYGEVAHLALEVYRLASAAEWHGAVDE